MVSTFVGETVPFRATSKGSRFVVSDDSDGITISIGSHAHLALEVNYRCELGPDSELEAARLSKIHFPMGGARFRPTMEDVLHMIEEEFGAVAGPGWQEILGSNRMEWRRQQTGAAVRDCPSEAVRVLKQLGYGVEDPSDGPVPDRTDPLTAF